MWLQLSLVSRKCQVTVATEREFFKGSFLVLENWLAKYSTTRLGAAVKDSWLAKLQTQNPEANNHVPYPQTRTPRPS